LDPRVSDNHFQAKIARAFLQLAHKVRLIPAYGCRLARCRRHHPSNKFLTLLLDDRAGGYGKKGTEHVNRLPMVSALAVLLSGCSLAGNRDVQAYNACLARHPQDVVVCEGPRQAYEIDDATFPARSAAIRPTAGYTAEEVLAVSAPQLTPVTLHPDPMPVFNLNGHDACTAVGPMTTVCNQ
jgi:hypothetical protein